MKILIADKFSENAVAELKSLGNEVLYDANLKEETLLAGLQKFQPHVLVVRSTKVTSAMLTTSSQLLLVVRAGAGVNTIDTKTASKSGIFVANCPGKNAIAVAELTMGLILSLDRRIPDNVSALRAGKWLKSEYSKTRGIKGRTLGIMGFGNIGKELAKRALAHEMNILVWSRSLNDEIAKEHSVTRVATPIELASNSDIVSVHLELSDATKKFCNKTFFNAMKQGSFFINTSRGEIVDEEALIDALNSKGIKAGLDVFVDEPISSPSDWQSKLASHPSVYGCHHIGASTEQAEEAIGVEALKIIKMFTRKGEVLNCVNIEVDSPATHILNVRHLNRVGVLAAVLGEIQKASINVLEMENEIFLGDEAAIAKIGLSKEPNSSLLDAIKNSHTAIISLTVMQVRH